MNKAKTKFWYRYSKVKKTCIIILKIVHGFGNHASLSSDASLPTVFLNLGKSFLVPKTSEISFEIISAHINLNSVR